MRHRAAGLALALLVVVGLAAPAAPAALAAASSGPKVVIIVGATHSATSSYRSRADVAAAEAAKYTKNVVKVYSPNATWSAVKSALQGASVVLYLGHGNGFPSPYRTTPYAASQNGFGLNAAAGQGDDNTKYYGESYIAADIRLAPNAVVILNHLCYASGNSEPDDPEPTVSVAHQRIDNYAAGFLKAGARAVLAEAHIGADWWMRTLFTTRQTIEQAWRSAPYGSGHIVSFASSRSPGYTAFSDPETPTSGFYRSFVGRAGLTTSEVIAAGLPDTGSDPTDFVVPGAASVGPGGATALPAPPTSAAAVTSDTAAAGTPIAAGTALRVVSEAAPLPNGDRVLEVETLDAHPLGYVVASALVPRDSLSPTVTPIASELAITPNDDGMADRLILDARFSETVTWRFQIRSKAGATVYDANGKGAALAVDWDGMNKGAPIPDGTYPWSLTATDAWGNPPLARSGTVVRSGSIVLGPESTYVPLGPVRLLDSRIGNGLAGTFSAATPRVLQLTGRGGIPAGATAVTVNLTIVGQSAPGYVALTPTPTAAPATSTLNVPAGDTRANGATVPLSASGSLALVYMAPAGARTHLLLDVTGYYTAGAGGATYVPLGPVRLLDSRIGNGLAGTFSAATPRVLQLTGRGGIPAGATAVTVNLTIVGQSAPGYVALTPTPTAAPATSTLNVPAGDTRANGATVPLSASGSLALVYMAPAGARTHLLLDVTGYYTAGAGGATYVPLGPVRLLDSRIGNGLAGTFSAATPRVLQLTGRGGIPAGATAVTVNLTIVGQSAPGYVALTPTPTAAPATSTLNVPAGDTRANGATVPLSASGSLALVYMAPAGARTHLLLDVTGFFR